MTRSGAVLMLMLLGFYAICEGNSVLKSETEEEVLQRRKRDGGFSAIISLASAAVTAGGTVGAATATFNGLTFNVKMQMGIENLSKWPMVVTYSVSNGGLISSPLPLVQPGKKEAFVTHKVGDTATGTYGTAGWRIQGVGHVIVMWSVPYDHNYHSNWLGIGVKSETPSDTQSLYNQMYYGPQTWFKRKEYYRNQSPVNFCVETICIHGSMGSAHRTQARITILPRDHANLASTVKQTVSAQSWNQAMTNLASNSK